LVFHQEFGGKKKGETIYSLNWLPIGGFVKLYGEDDAGAGRIEAPKTTHPTKDIDRAFFSRSIGQRAAVIVAGVVMNTLLAILFTTFLCLSATSEQSYHFLGIIRFFSLISSQNRHFN